jgi:hypothetical protein
MIDTFFESLCDPAREAVSFQFVVVFSSENLIEGN